MSEIILPGLHPIPKKPLFKFQRGDRVRIITPAFSDNGKLTIYESTALFDFVRSMERSIGQIDIIKNVYDRRVDQDTGIEYDTYTLEEHTYAYRSFFLAPDYVDNQQAIELLKERFQNKIKE